MKNSLSTNSIIPLIASWKDLKEAVRSGLDAETPFPISVQGLHGSLPAFYIGEWIKGQKSLLIHNSQFNEKIQGKGRDIIIFTATQKDAEECESDLLTVLGDEADIYIFPWWGMLPYRPAGKGSALFGSRASVLARLTQKNTGSKARVFIVSQRALLSPLPDPNYLKKQVFRIRKSQGMNIMELSKRLSEMGYLRVPKVGVRGEYAIRGEVVDIFMPGEERPDRLVFDFDTVEQIKSFDVETQSSKENKDSLLVYPMKEVLWNDDLVSKLESILERQEKGGIVNNFAEYDKLKKKGGRDYSTAAKAKDTDEGDKTSPFYDKADEVHLSFTAKAKEEKDRILTELMVNHESEGEELFYGILWDRLYSFVDYIDENDVIFCYDWERLSNTQDVYRNEFEVSYRTARQNLPVLKPSYMLLDFSSLMNGHSNHIRFCSLPPAESLESKDTEKEGSDNPHGSIFRLDCQPSENYLGNINYFKEQLEQRQKDFWHIYIFADNPNQALRLQEVVRQFMSPEDTKLYPVQVLSQPLTQGFCIGGEKILVIQENEIFGRKKHTPKSLRKVRSEAINTFVDLHTGDYVVHANYGIGRFMGIERIKAAGTERDYIKLEYADEESIFVPIEQVNMVQRYIGNENTTPKLDKIGSKSWSARKAKAQQKAEEIAEKLIDLYSKRQSSRGYAFPKDTEWQAAFEAAFPYEDTADQFTATEEIKADMERPVPMDRLVCGDVGYGKTEIAMRAAFKAVMGGKQVAFLAPTTILSEQHYENALERFKNFPVKIAQLSRFISPADQKKTLALLEQGQVDILVGTHRILQKDVVYKDLGLLIIDEEQRFGVKDKEKLKVMKNNVDCLAMSATPIPRTLHMSLLKIRDISLLATPPQNRQAIETSVEAYSEEKIAAAIRNEVSRGGQVFFLHNRVESLEETRIRLQQMVPEMLIETAHGQMEAEELDDIFRRFKMGGFHVLVATTIIENGIDIPNVNTIIIDRADMYGISQLYQLRGRVGRSDRKAYAYLFYPEHKALSEDAMKRLQVIGDFTELGSGFKIAMKDMEIRGAGDLLGRDQSGESIHAVGFEMYLYLVNSAIQKLSDSDWMAPEEVLLELEYSGYIPDTYISDDQTKMEMYKKISAVKKDQELEAISEELNDRFGPVPAEVSSLLNLAAIRIICTKLGITSLVERKQTATVEFSRVAKVNVDKLLGMIKSDPASISLDPQHPNRLMLKTKSIDLNTKCEFICGKLGQLV